MKLTESEREQIISALRVEAESDMARLGCTCEPRWSLSDALHGPYLLPMWESEHADDCALVQRAGMKPDDRALLLGSSVMERLR